MNAVRLDTLSEQVGQLESIRAYGRVVEVVGLTVEATSPPAHVGDLCWALPPSRDRRIPLEVVGFRGNRLLMMPLGDLNGIGPGALLLPARRRLGVRVGDDMLGRVVDGLGRAIDGGPPIEGEEEIDVHNTAPAPMERRRLVEPIATGVRAVDACITCGKGQRVGIMSGSGVGKSKLLGMIARNTDADINVIALIGERGKEVRDFVEVDLGEEGLKRSVVVAATSNEPALVRIKGAHLATAIAEWYRLRGKNVMLMMDSVTRFAMAQREVGLAVGEPPTTKGYPPSVYAELPRLLERSGATRHGTITGFYSVLVEGDDLNDPIGDAVRSILDGHIVLSRDLASRGHYPAVDILQSVSRVMIDVTSDEHRNLATQMRTHLATYRETEDLINIGAYSRGSNPEVDRAIDRKKPIDAFLRQGLFEGSPFDELEPKMRAALR